MSRQISKHMKKIRKEENKILNRKEIKLVQSAIQPIKNKIQEYIPIKLQSTLDQAFYKGFWLVFEKGNRYIEKTYSKNKIQLEYDLNNYAIDKSNSKKYIKQLEKRSNQSKNFHSTLSVIEGGVLGALGIGLPDIPLFIAVMLRAIYEIALSYGYSYDSEEEKIYILLLISGALSNGDKQKEYNKKLDILGSKIDGSNVVDLNIDDQMKDTAGILSEAMLTAKFVQGFPIIGAVGGVVNYNMIRKITRYASVKYKKRYYLKKTKK